MDILDGGVARARGESSPLGQELDSLADIVSFGVAPAVMAFSAGLRGEWDCLCLMIFVACGISRLARYNVTAPALAAETGKVPYYEGLPIPTSLLLVTMVGILAATGNWQDELPLGVWSGALGSFHPLSLVYLVHGCGMISKTLRVPKP
jgi:CDP-diacylglycerol--serine O-phosphatidyltransferase